MDAVRPWRPGRALPADASELPLPGLVLTSGIADDAAFETTLAALRCRHVADLLGVALPDGSVRKGFKVIDGAWFAGRGLGTWVRGDLDLVRDAEAVWVTSPSAGPAHYALGVLRERLAADPMAVRRILLYQLSCRLRDTEPTADAAKALGVDGDEAGPLADAVRARFPASPRVRAAAAELPRAWAERRLRRCAEIVRELPADHGDPEAGHVAAALGPACAEADALAAEAAALTAQGRHTDAVRAWARVLDVSADEPDALARLLGALVAAADGGSGVRRADADVVRGSDVQVVWSPVRVVGHRVFRFPEDRPDEAVEVADTLASQAADLRPNPATRLRYAVVPSPWDQVAEAAWVSPPVTVLPEVGAAEARVVPEGVRITWRAPRAAVAVAVTCGPDPGGPFDRPVDCGRGDALDRDAPLGRHHYRVACAYDAPDGRRLWSPGVVLTAEVAAWPSLVTRLEAHADAAAQTVRVSWQPPDRGSAQVVPWLFAPVAPGAKVPQPVPTPAAATDGVFEVGDWTTMRLTAVSVLGDRAVAGATVLIDAPGAVAELTARRLADDRAEVRFRWPEPAVLVLVAWEQDGVRHSRRLPRSACRDVPVELAVTGAACAISVTPLTRPDADIGLGETATVRLAAVPGMAGPAQPWPPAPAWPVAAPPPPARRLGRLLRWPWFGARRR